MSLRYWLHQLDSNIPAAGQYSRLFFPQHYFSLVFVCRSIAEKGPSTEEKIQSLEAVISNYEVKVSGLEHEIETQKEEYEQRLEQFTKR